MQVLGAIAAVAPGGRHVRLGGTQQQRLLAALATEPDRPVNAGRLIEILWPDGAPESAHGTVQRYVSRLRTQLGHAAVVTSELGYALSSSALDLDTARFERLLADARLSDPLNALALYDEALGVWRGPAFGVWAGEWWAKPVADRLEALRSAAAGERVDALLGLGRADEALADTEVLVAAEPLRESVVRQRMLAQHLSGRSADALRGAAGFRRRLLDQAGLEPSPALAELEHRILEHDPRLATQPPSRSMRGYVIGALLAEGAHGAVFAATQPALGRDVAIKVVRRDRADDPEFVRRFEAEAQLVARLEHPSIVPLYDFWREPGEAFLVFRFLRGGSLQDLLARGVRFPLGRVDQVVEHVGDALAAAHRAGVAHRDVRPANVLFDDDEHPYLADFGIAVEDPDDDAAHDDVAGLAEVALQLLGRLDPVAGVELEPRRSVLRRACAGEIATIVDLLREWRLACGATTSSTPTPDRPRARRRTPGPIGNPYKGLRPFTEAERGDFFGRVHACEQLVAVVAERPFVVVVGPSGSGKSSLVLAGLVPRLRDGGSVVTTMTPGVRPMWSLATALRRVATQAQVTAVGDDPGALLRTLAHERPLLLVVDQLEELWTVAVATDRDAFVGALDEVLEDPLSLLRVVATVRADFYDRPLADPRLGPRTRDGSYPLAPLTAAELEAAIVGPLTGSGVGVEPGLVTQIVSDVMTQAGALPQLQFTLSTLFDTRDDDLVTHRAYAQLGGVAGAVASEAESLHQQFSPENQEHMRQLFETLVTPGDGTDDTRRRAALSELGSVPSEVLEHLDHARLVTFDRDAATGAATVEIAHEALLVHWPRLRTWIDASRDELHAHRQLRDATAAWVRASREPSHLYRGARLAAALERVDLSRVGADERTFLDISIAARDRDRSRERRRLRRTQTLLVATAALLVVALVAALVAVDQRAEARHNANEAQASTKLATGERVGAELRRIALEARTVAPGQPDLGLLLAAEVAQRRPGTESDSALLAALQANPSIDRLIDLGFREDDRIHDVAGTVSGLLIAATEAEAVIVDARTLLPNGVRWPLDGVSTVAISLGGAEAATVSTRGRLERRSPITGEPTGPVLRVEPGTWYDRATPLAYLADGSLAVGNGAAVEIYPTGASTPTRTLRFSRTVVVLRASPDGRRLVVSGLADPTAASTVLVDIDSGTVMPLGPPVLGVAFGPGTTIYLGVVGLSSKVVAYDTTTGKATAETPGSSALPRTLIPRPDGTIVRGTSLNDVDVVSADLQSSRTLPTPSPIIVMAALPDGRVLGALGGRLVVVDVDGQPLPVTALPLVGAVFPELVRDRFVLSGPDGARLYDAATLQPIGPTIAELANRVRGQIDLAPDGSLVAGRVGAQVLVYDAATGRRVGPALAAPLQFGQPRFSPDGTKLAVVTAESVTVHSVPDLTAVRAFPISSVIGLDLVWSPDSRELVYSELGTLGHRLDVATGRDTPLGTLIGVFSNDGTHLTTFQTAGPIRVYDRASGTLEASFTGFREPGWGRYLPGDRRMFRSAVGPYYDLIDMTTGSRIGEPFRFGDNRGAIGTISVGLAADGSHALIGTPGSPVKRIELDPRRWLEMACDAAGRNLTRAEWARYFGAIADYDVTCPQYPPGR